jgi:hypothetical protein
MSRNAFKLLSYVVEKFMDWPVSKILAATLALSLPLTALVLVLLLGNKDVVSLLITGFGGIGLGAGVTYAATKDSHS